MKTLLIIYTALAILNKVSTFSVSDYLYPRFYWPLDYPTWIREVIESKNTIVTGQQIGITGPNPGFIKFGITESSVKLGQFDEICFTKIAECSQGITVSVWTYIANLNLKSETANGVEEFSVLRTTPHSDGSSVLKVWYSSENGKTFINAAIQHQMKYHARQEVESNQWYHIILQYSTSTGFKFYVNLQLTDQKSSPGTPQVIVSEVELLLGQYPSKNGIGNVLSKAILHVDNLAIWRELLSMDELHSIYKVGLGDLKLKPGCENSLKEYVVKWIKPLDFYSHISEYKITWKVNKKREEQNSIIIPASSSKSFISGKIMEVTLDFYNIEMEYTIEVNAFSKGGITIGDKVICSASNNKGNSLSISSTTPLSLSLNWESPSRITNAIYNITYSSVQDGIEKRLSINKKNLNTNLENLQPFTLYSINVTRFVNSTRIKSYHHGNYKTLPIAPTFNTSIIRMEIKNITWKSIILKLILHPELKDYPMMYQIYQIGGSRGVTKRINVQYYKEFVLEVNGGLKENTSYSFDVELFDKGSTVSGPKLKEKVTIKTKVRMPPPKEIIGTNISTTSMTLQVILPTEAYDPAFNLTIIYVEVSTSDSLQKFLFPITNPMLCTITGLQQYTNYTISVATGIGSIGGTGYNGVMKTITISTLDINECMNEKQCGENGICRNTPGSYKCSCELGYQRNNEKCQDIDECGNTTICSENAVCLNTVGSFKCQCKDGYQMNDKTECADIDECSSTTICSENAVCLNAIGSYNCQCKDGYKMNEGKECQDINECGNNTICSENAVCLNAVGSYKCQCKDGYQMNDKKECQDINECGNNTICSENAVCLNAVGSFMCQCKDGYQMNDGKECKDINECSIENVCGKNFECKNKPGSYDCYCKNGFQFVNQSCIDIDECLSDKTCKQNFVCFNTIGSFSCQCPKGYLLIGRKCRELNECLDDVCAHNEICVNTPGSYMCKGKNGFYMEKKICTAQNTSESCPEDHSRGIDWKTTEQNTIAVLPCPKGSIGNATRECASVGKHEKKAKWRKANLNSCNSQELTTLMRTISKNTKKSLVANNIRSFVKKERSMHGGDLLNVVEIMENIASTENIIENAEEADQFSETMVDITSSLLDQSSAEAWEDLTPEKKSKQAEKLLTTSESVIEVSAKHMSKNETSKIIVTNNIVMRLQKLPTDDIKNDDVVSVTSDQSIALPGDALQNDGADSSVAIVTYKGLSDLIGVPKKSTIGKTSENLTMNSNILSISIFPQKKKTFDKPVVIIQEFSEPPLEGTEPNCVYWQVDEIDGGYWSTKGCSVYQSNNSHVTCHCYHLTNFAVLMSVTDAADNLSGDHKLALNLITLIGISISLVAMVASFLTFVLIRVIRSLRNTIHKNLVIALFIAEGLFLFGIDKTQNRIACQVIAASLHYFFLVAFFIMALEGILLYLMLVRVYRSLGTDGYGSARYIAVCWVLPILFIGINVSIDRRAYGYNRDYCWLSLKDGFIWSFVGPVLLIVVLNFIILFKTLHIMSIKAKKRSSTSEEIWFWMKGSCLLLSILGITWVLGIFYVDMNTLFAAYLFNIVNSLQGLSIFVFHCVLDPRVRKAYYNFICCVRHRPMLLRSQSRTRTTSTGSSLKKKSKSKSKYTVAAYKGEDVALYDNGNGPDSSFNRSSSTPENSFGVLVGTNKF